MSNKKTAEEFIKQWWVNRATTERQKKFQLIVNRELDAEAAEAYKDDQLSNLKAKTLRAAAEAGEQKLEINELNKDAKLLSQAMAGVLVNKDGEIEDLVKCLEEVCKHYDLSLMKSNELKHIVIRAKQLIDKHNIK